MSIIIKMVNSNKDTAKKKVIKTVLHSKNVKIKLFVEFVRD